jgi:hypothetical protein
VWSVTLTLVLVFAVPYASGQLIASDVKAGKPYTPRYLVGLPSLGSLDVRADCVTVKNKDDGKVVDEEIAPPKVLYLGHDSDFLVLYQSGIGPLRLPAGDYILSTVTTMECQM